MKILLIDEDAFFLQVVWRPLARIRFPAGIFGKNAANRVATGTHIK